MSALRLGWAADIAASGEERRAREFEASLTEAELRQLARLPRALRAKLFERMGLPPPEGDRRGRHWAALREARRYEVRRERDGGQVIAGRVTLEVAASAVGVAPEYLAEQFRRLRGTARRVEEGDLVVVERSGGDAPRPPGRPRVRRSRR